ncbi:MAG: Ig-like domain repeat protein [Verrucomicrobia bacterium]|nr:Ig-like domain repeat protein [Verrucomicrobiota bacterium]
MEYDVTALGVAVISPAAGQGSPIGTSITATANVQDPGAFTHTVTFHTTPIAPAGPTVDTVSTDTTSPFTAVLGTLPAGTYQIYATVVNSANPPGMATSAVNTFTVAAAVPTTTTLATSATPSTYGQNVTFTATVAPPPTGGTVQFYDGASALGKPVAVNTETGEARLTASTLGVGTRDLTAIYSGHGLHVASTSDILTQVVDKAQLTVKALDVLRAPNAANPDPLPYQLFGYQNGETLATSGVTGTPTLTTTAVLSSPVGTYDITCALGSLAAANYSFTDLVNGTLTVAVVADTFSVNFTVSEDSAYGGGLNTAEQWANVVVGPSMPAGLSGWLATGWLNFLVPWDPDAPLAPVTLTSTLGSTATFTLKTCRNGWTYDGPRTTLLGDGNGNMMDGHVNSTLDASELFDMEVTNIPCATYDVIFYMGISREQYGDGTGVIVFNGGAERGFTVKDGAFDGTFTEMVNATTPGNYILFTGVTGSSFTTQTWGLGPTGFNHVGPFGFQIKNAAPAVRITGITGPDPSGNFTIAGGASTSAKVGLFRSTEANAPLTGVGWTQDGASQTGTSFSFTGTGGGAQAFFILKVVP